jgi:ketosteroid isomerase-like protein
VGVRGVANRTQRPRLGLAAGAAADDIDAIRSAYSVWNRGDVNGLLEAMGDEVEWFRSSATASQRIGFVATRASGTGMKRLAARSRTFRAEIEDVIEVGDGRYLVKPHFSGYGKASVRE